MDAFRDLLCAHRVVAIVRAADPLAAAHTTQALFDAGLSLVEVSLTTPNALGVIAGVAKRLPSGCRLGAGTVLTDDDARAAVDAGADFLVTPAVTPAIETGAALGVPVLAGALTPTEVVAAVAAGATAVKLFPASLGGLAYFKALREPLPGVAFVPVGGIDPVLARAYLEAGAVAVGVGGPLLGDAVRGGDLDGLRERAQGWRALAGS